MSPEYYKELFDVPVKYNGFVGTTTDKSKDGEDFLSKDLMKNTDIGSVNFITNTSEHFKQTMGSIDSVVVVLIVSAAALAFVVMYNLTNINISERIRELATIKVLGFYDSEVAAYVYRENVVLSIIGTILGLFLGIGLHRYVVVTAEIDMVMFVRTIKAIDFIHSAILTIVFSGLVNIVMYRRLKKIDMVESLKSAE
jgi:putative ABC transport system permease protein